jgi:hypothetical protein
VLPFLHLLISFHLFYCLKYTAFMHIARETGQISGHSATGCYDTTLCNGEFRAVVKIVFLSNDYLMISVRIYTHSNIIREIV